MKEMILYIKSCFPIKSNFVKLAIFFYVIRYINNYLFSNVCRVHSHSFVGIYYNAALNWINAQPIYDIHSQSGFNYFIQSAILFTL